MPGRHDGSRTSHRNCIDADSIELLSVARNCELNCSLHIQSFTKSKSGPVARAFAMGTKIERQDVESGPAKKSSHTAEVFPICPDTMARHDERRSCLSVQEPRSNGLPVRGGEGDGIKLQPISRGCSKDGSLGAINIAEGIKPRKEDTKEIENRPATASMQE